MKNKVLFIGFMILFVISQKIASTQTTIECRPQAATDWTGYAWKTLYTIYGKSDGEIQVGQDLTDKERGWAKIDISAIPLDAIITDITLKLYVNSPSTSSNHDLVIRKVSSDPVSTSASTLYNQIGTGTWYGYDGNAGVSSGYKYIDLEPVAISDLQTIVSNNSQEWFAIGFWEWDDDVNSCDIDGWDWSSNPSNSNAEPILIVDYDTPSCSVSVPSGNLVSSSSGNINFSVTSNGISNWSASESCNWLSISPTSGNGNGTITISYQENTSIQRSCNITVSCGSSSDSYTLTQEGAECEVEVSPQGISQSADAGSYSFSVISNGISNWSASESCNWLSISPTSGNGNGTITITYQENTSQSDRECVILVSCGNSSDGFHFEQDPADCEVSVSPSGSNVSSSSGSTSFSVISNGMANWSASENCDWLSISPISGNGNGTITIAYQENTSNIERTYTINLSCNNFNASYTLSQNPPDCVVSVDPFGSNVSSSSGSTSFSVISNGVANWTASENCNWLSISPISGNENGTITITYQENTSNIERDCDISISCNSSSDTYTLTQGHIIDNVNEVEYFDKINIIPNPNSGRFILEIETAKAIDLQLKLFNVFGQLMYEDKLGIVSGTIKKNVSVGNFPAGVYTIQLSSMESVVSRMILVE